MKIFKLTVFVLLLCCITACNSKENHSTSTATDDVDIEFIKQGEVYLMNESDTIKFIDAEFAENDNSRRNGLMNRNTLAENQGMLFVFQEDNNTSFWMKNTRIPLSIMFFNKDSVLINYHDNAQPYETNIKYGADSIYRFVLEANGGSAEKWGVKPGLTKLSYIKN